MSGLVVESEQFSINASVYAITIVNRALLVAYDGGHAAYHDPMHETALSCKELIAGIFME